MARSASPATVYIRSLVSADKTITFGTAKDRLKEAGYGDVTESAFNMTKYLWLRHKQLKNEAKKVVEGKIMPPPKHKKVTNTPVQAEVNITDALKFVADNGGLSKIKTTLAERRAALEREEALVAAFESLSVQVKAAS